MRKNMFRLGTLLGAAVAVGALFPVFGAQPTIGESGPAQETQSPSGVGLSGVFALRSAGDVAISGFQTGALADAPAELMLPENIAVIENEAFACCSSLRQLTIPHSARTNLKTDLFKDTPIAELTVLATKLGDAIEASYLEKHTVSINAFLFIGSASKVNLREICIVRPIPESGSYYIKINELTHDVVLDLSQAEFDNGIMPNTIFHGSSGGMGNQPIQHLSLQYTYCIYQGEVRGK